ncbi:MAG TPA: gliding motility-associated C-terminal domain-containing protein, partial [Flavobacterium sp.]|nr:gliding motility-associated C-terminal domain-containing protein [Flavobacterium sp.]
MGLKLHKLLWLPLLLLSCVASAQDISLYQQFNGRYDFKFVGNTLVPFENNLDAECSILLTSSAVLTLDPNETLQKAYLYWAGSGTGDLTVKINGFGIPSERQFALFDNELDYFCAFADITPIVAAIGNGTYTLTDLDLQDVLTPDAYCNNRTNFGGWAIVVVYEDPSLPLNQLNIYDGLQGVSANIQSLSLQLNSINVIDSNGAKIGFVAWEGDANLDANETLRINNNILSNALNPPTNAFNGSNTFTGSSTMYNMDLDSYDIQNYITAGSTTANISLTSSADFVMISTIVTKLNSQLPDATIHIDDVILECESREITVDYTVSNINSTAALPAGVPIAIYADGVLIGTAITTQALAIGESYSATITLVLPAGVADNFELMFFIDRNLQGFGTVNETNENNNTDTEAVSLLLPPTFNLLPAVNACNEGFGAGTFDFSAYEDLIVTNPLHTANFYATMNDAVNGVNEILNSSAYFASSTPTEIFALITDERGCTSITSFTLDTNNCPPIVYNFISANNDGANDVFFIRGLRNIFLNFELQVYNRWGVLVWKGNHNIPDWDGFATEGPIVGSSAVPDGT